YQWVRSQKARPRWRRVAEAAIWVASPSFGQLSVSPIPQQVEHDLDWASGSIVDRHAHAEIAANVLAAADGDLHLGQHVPIGFRAAYEIAVGEELHHGRPE